MAYTADEVLDSIQRKTDLVISHITDHTGKFSTDAKIHSMELFIGAVEQELKFRPARRGRRSWPW